MYTIKLDVNDSIYDKVMFFLNNISKNDLKIKEIKNHNEEPHNNLVEFFRNSPLVGEIELQRDSETYSDRVSF